MICVKDGTEDMIGKRLGNYTEADIKHLANASVLRVGKPGSAFTMDYREDRVNVIVDENDIITRVYCG